MLALIVAVAHNRVIGKDNTLIWHLPNDLKFFKEKTTGHVIIMGRKTFESLPFLLPNREHWVITKDKGFDAPEGVRIFHSPEAVAEAAKDLDAAYVIGGAQIYEAFLPFVDVMHITEVDHTFEGDAFFPEFDASQFEIVETIEGTVDEKNKYPHKFVTYKRK
ncbi:dihydrofolate reductase [Veillonella sp. YH-vei2232]|jgi:dihydrofolate reductase|uniref:Dihydrofolate reductase n=1 Tax=Veillonella absiana TaxID=3079305 RepID=A0ABU3Z994_9FIRM|nr:MULTISPECIES: dihydrofolate reductase [unclassified Veillonella]NCB95716.1 dihydrofolate reductase [Negativicutes bacterium]MBK7920851.1 dihydrofolate reductase [Veillonella sp.]MBP6923484.1 dihydrofolate reductase [Veillonella sp.]MBP8616917.1 dihydrofolate reductase [Veillonella sp.]MBP9517076.1 dihydrofolate reductase [Veillonella sp.]